MRDRLVERPGRTARSAGRPASRRNVGQRGRPRGRPRRPAAATTRKPRGARRPPSGLVAGVEGLAQPFQAEGEADAAVVAVAAEHAGQAVVPAAAADLDRTVGGRHDELEDHLRVEADAPAEAEVELDAVEVDAVVLEQAAISSRSAATESGASRGVRRGRGGRGPRRRGRAGRPGRGPGRGRRRRASWRRVAQLPLAPQAADDLVAGAAAGDVRHQVPEQAVDAAGRRRRSTGGGVARRARRRRGASRRAGRAPSPGPGPSCPSAAASLSISTRAEVAAGGQARAAAASRGSGRRGRSGSSRPATPASRSDQSASQITSASAAGPPAPISSTPTWVNSRSRSGAGGSEAEDRARRGSTRQGSGRARRPRRRPGRCPAVSSGRRQIPAVPARRPDLEQLRDDPRAALALVQLGRAPGSASATARSRRGRSGRAASVPARRAGRIVGQPVARASHEPTAAPARSRGRERRVAVRVMPCMPLAARGSPATPWTESSRTDQGIALVLLPGGEVAEVEDLARPPRRGRRSPPACGRGSSRSPSACRSGSGRGRPRRRCPPARSRAASRTAIAGSVAGEVGDEHRGRRRGRPRASRPRPSGRAAGRARSTPRRPAADAR